jgi:hypothetical protein
MVGAYSDTLRPWLLAGKLRERAPERMMLRVPSSVPQHEVKLPHLPPRFTVVRKISSPWRDKDCGEGFVPVPALGRARRDQSGGKGVNAMLSAVRKLLVSTLTRRMTAAVLFVPATCGASGCSTARMGRQCPNRRYGAGCPQRRSGPGSR